jgi:hypothetical protein
MDYELERVWKVVVIAHFRVVLNHVTGTNDVFPLSRWPVVVPEYQEYEIRELINILPAPIVTVLNCKYYFNRPRTVLRQGESLKFLVVYNFCISICSFLAFRL